MVILDMHISPSIYYYSPDMGGSYGSDQGEK